MSTLEEQRTRSYRRLEYLYGTLRATFKRHLDSDLLAELGIDVSMVDLYEETEHGGPYYLPMSQIRLESFDTRPDFAPDFCMEHRPWNEGDGSRLLRELTDQLRGDGSLFSPYEKTQWYPKKCRHRSMQSMLSESEGGSYFDPTRQYQWALRSVFETKSVPHLICMSQHTLSRVQGPIRSEIMIVAAMAAVRFKKKCFQDQSVFPILLFSVIGRSARIIQAHMCPREQRLKVRYSQMFDFSNNTLVKRDLFTRWLFCDPIAEMNPLTEGLPLPIKPVGDTAPLLRAAKATRSSPSTRRDEDLPKDGDTVPPVAAAQAPRRSPTTGCYEDMPRDFAAMSIRAMASVA